MGSSLSERDCLEQEEGTGEQQDNTSNEKDNEKSGVAYLRILDKAEVIGKLALSEASFAVNEYEGDELTILGVAFEVHQQVIENLKVL